MKIGVLIKQVPDSESKIRVKADGSGVEGIEKYTLNPYDEFAVEEALKLQAQFKGETVVFTLGPKRSEDAMRTALAMGIDKGVRIEDAGMENADSLGVSRAIAAAVKSESLDILFCGKQAIDDDSAQVPQIVAELLDWPQATVVDKFEAQDEKTATVHRRVSGGAKEIIKLNLPAVVSADKGLNSPRYPSLPGIMKAKKKPLDVKNVSALGLSPSDVAPLVNVTRYHAPPSREAGKMLKGDTAQVVSELVKLLHEEAKVI